MNSSIAIIKKNILKLFNYVTFIQLLRIIINKVQEFCINLLQIIIWSIISDFTNKLPISIKI